MPVAVNELSYPPAAVTARIMGVVFATVTFDNQGAVASVDTKGYPLLASSVVVALSLVPPRTECSGQKIAMRFSFVLDQNLDPEAPISVTSASSLDYRVVAPSPVIETTVYDPPEWVFTRRGRFFHHLKTALSKL